jgi:hypothetical protein
MYTQFYSEYLLEDLDVDGGVTLKCMLKKEDMGWIQSAKSTAK